LRSSKKLSSGDEQAHGSTRDFHIRLAAERLERRQGTIRVPEHDEDYVRFREELRQKLMGKGDGDFWGGLEIQDELR
jgi:hypothetical protein